MTNESTVTLFEFCLLIEEPNNILHGHSQVLRCKFTTISRVNLNRYENSSIHIELITTDHME